ncbi:MAG: TonB-dependent receptor [Bacteroidales bacterium]|nr:TonB-dependent receptor [Bacteroidales bacterium]
MRKIVLSLIIIIGVSGVLPAQTIKVIDSEDRKPIRDVAVFNESKTRFGYTDLSGEFRIDAFRDNAMVHFQHPSYENTVLSMDQLEEMDYSVILRYKTFEIDEFVVSANRWEQDRDEVPNKITPISKATAEFANPQTAADLLGISGEVYVQKSQLGGGSPMIRGFATHRVLLVVDGVRMNNAIFREGNLQNVISLDANMIANTEIIFGPGAVVYGSDAIGGVMDFHSKKALLSTGDKINLKVNALGRTSSANNERTGHVDINLGGSKIAFMAGYTYSDFDDLRMGSRGNDEYIRNEYQVWEGSVDAVHPNTDPDIQLFSGYSQHNITAKLRFQPTDKLSIHLINHTGISSDIPRYDRLIQYKDDVLKYGDWYYGPQEWMMNNLTVKWSPGNAFFDVMKAVAARQDFAESRHDRKLNSTMMRERYEQVIAWSLGVDFEKEIDEKLLFYGLEAVTNDVNSTAEGRDIITGETYPESSRYPDGDNRYNTLSAYAGMKYSLSDKFFINGGLRYNYTTLHSDFIDNSFFNFPFDEINISNGALTGSIGGVWQAGEKTKLSMNASTGFRAPNIDDAAKVFDSEPGSVVVPNPDLSSEYAYNLDIGFTRDLFDMFHFELTGFITCLDNAMVRREYSFDGNDSILYQGEMSQVLAIVNAGSATVYGGQMSLQFSPVRNFRIKSHLNLTRGRDNEGVPFRHVPPTYGITHVIYENKTIKIDLYARYNGEMSYEDMAPSEVGKTHMYATDGNGNPYSPSWHTFNLKASYQMGNIAFIDAGVENIFDQRYRPYASGIAAPGRNFLLALRLKI